MERGLRWRLVVIATAAMLAIEVAIIALYGTGEEAIRVTLRATSRVAGVLFVLAYTASAAHRLWPSPWTAWPLHNRRYLGLSVASAMTIHLIAIAMLIPRFRPDEGGMTTFFLGGGAFVSMYAMAATSNDAAVRWLGGRNWARLHRFGLHYLWIVLTFTFAGGASAGSVPSAIATALLVAGLGIRLWARFRRRN
jgi:DMSO/TMAO reductase YedYZ heme-binding membrane subunit